MNVVANINERNAPSARAELEKWDLHDPKFPPLRDVASAETEGKPLPSNIMKEG